MDNLTSALDSFQGQSRRAVSLQYNTFTRLSFKLIDYSYREMSTSYSPPVIGLEVGYSLALVTRYVWNTKQRSPLTRVHRLATAAFLHRVSLVRVWIMRRDVKLAPARASGSPARGVDAPVCMHCFIIPLVLHGPIVFSKDYPQTCNSFNYKVVYKIVSTSSTVPG